MTLNCPNCSSLMLEVRKHGVHLDYCSVCSGIWLDRDEIDMILSASSNKDVSDVEVKRHANEFRIILAELKKEGRIL